MVSEQIPPPEKPHVHGEWTDSPTHQQCERAGWCCLRCGVGHETDPGSCVRCGYTVLAPLWRLGART